MKQKLIIPCFNYPPLLGVGSLRWLNISRELSLFFDVEIWTVDRTLVDNSSLQIDALHSNYVVTNFSPCFLPCLLERRFYPKILNQVIQKSALKLSSFSHPTDYAQYWPLNLCDILLESLNLHPIFLLTAAPYSLQYRIASYLESFGYKRYILDFQDPFTTDPFRKYSTSFLKRKDQEKEEFLLSRTDVHKVFVTNGLQSSMIIHPMKASVVENGHDFYSSKGVLLKSFQKHSFQSTKRLKILYLGTLANGRDSLFIDFMSSVRNYPTPLIIDVYGRVSLRLQSFLRHNFLASNLAVNIHAPVSRHDLPELASNYHIGLQINADQYPYLVSTKLYEYPALGLPVLSICNGGEISHIVSENQIGSVLPSNATADQLSSSIDFLLSIDIGFLEYYASKSTWLSRALEYQVIINTIL